MIRTTQRIICDVCGICDEQTSGFKSHGATDGAHVTRHEAEAKAKLDGWTFDRKFAECPICQQKGGRHKSRRKNR